MILLDSITIYRKYYNNSGELWHVFVIAECKQNLAQMHDM